jgi:hypothetical protein
VKGSRRLVWKDCSNSFSPCAIGFDGHRPALRFHFQFLQMLQQSAMDAAAKVLFELHDADAAESIFIGKRNEAAVISFFDGHFRHDKYARSSCHHRQNSGELAAFKNYIGLHTRTAARGQGVLAKTVAFFQKKKRVVLDLFKVSFALRCQAVILRDNQVKPFSKKLLA